MGTKSFASFRTMIGASLLALAMAAPACAAPKKDFKVAWSIYVGWMPWGYAADTGIVVQRLRRVCQSVHRR